MQGDSLMRRTILSGFQYKLFPYIASKFSLKYCIRSFITWRCVSMGKFECSVAPFPWTKHPTSKVSIKIIRSGWTEVVCCSKSDPIKALCSASFTSTGSSWVSPASCWPPVCWICNRLLSVDVLPIFFRKSSDTRDNLFLFSFFSVAENEPVMCVEDSLATSGTWVTSGFVVCSCACSCSATCFIKIHFETTSDSTPL